MSSVSQILLPSGTSHPQMSSGICSRDDFEADVTSDEFRIWCYKVSPCPITFAHSKSSCPYKHAGEKAGRRDPRLYSYSPIACAGMKRSGECAEGDACMLAHNVFEYWMHPMRWVSLPLMIGQAQTEVTVGCRHLQENRYRTQLCSFGISCRRPVCFFAHTPSEIRIVELDALTTMLQMEQLDCGFDSHTLPDQSLHTAPSSSVQSVTSWPGSIGLASSQSLPGEQAADAGTDNQLASTPEADKTTSRNVGGAKDMQASAAAAVADRLRTSQIAAGVMPQRSMSGPANTHLWQPMSMIPTPLLRGMSSQEGKLGPQVASSSHVTRRLPEALLQQAGSGGWLRSGMNATGSNSQELNSDPNIGQQLGMPGAGQRRPNSASRSEEIQPQYLQSQQHQQANAGLYRTLAFLRATGDGQGGGRRIDVDSSMTGALPLQQQHMQQQQQLLQQQRKQQQLQQQHLQEQHLQQQQQMQKHLQQQHLQQQQELQQQQLWKQRAFQQSHPQALPQQQLRPVFTRHNTYGSSESISDYSLGQSQCTTSAGSNTTSGASHIVSESLGWLQADAPQDSESMYSSTLRAMQMLLAKPQVSQGSPSEHGLTGTPSNAYTDSSRHSEDSWGNDLSLSNPVQQQPLTQVPEYGSINQHGLVQQQQLQPQDLHRLASGPVAGEGSFHGGEVNFQHRYSNTSLPPQRYSTNLPQQQHQAGPLPRWDPVPQATPFAAPPSATEQQLKDVLSMNGPAANEDLQRAIVQLLMQQLAQERARGGPE